MADSAAARKQAEGAHRHVEGLMSKDTKVKENQTSDVNNCCILENGSKRTRCFI